MQNYTDGEFKGKVLEKLENIETWLHSIEKNKVDRVEFIPVKSVVYGLVGLIMMAVVGGLVSSVIKALESFAK